VNRFSVRLFARYAELFAADQIDVALHAPSTVGAMISALRALPGGAALPATLLVAVNMRQASEQTAILPTDEIALLPPMAGG
jgi:molybdopterin converting factor small subunit